MAEIRHKIEIKMENGDVTPQPSKDEFITVEKKVNQPFEQRNKKNSTPDFGAFLHMLKCSLGSGILAMPNAFKNGGSIFSIFGTIITGIICTHCVHLLVYSSQYLSAKENKSSLGFPETAEVAFKNGPKRFSKYATFARNCVSAGLLATHYLGNTAYVIFMASTLKQVCDNNFEVNLNIRLYILLVAFPLIPFGSIRSLRYLVPLSLLASVLIITGLLMTLYYTFINLPAIDSTVYIGKPLQLPIFFSTALFAMEGIGMVLPIENSMRNPQHFLGCPGVLNIAMSIVITLYTVVGFFGYLKFGEHTKASITLNLGETKSAETVKMIVAISILFTYGLQFTVPTEIVWKWLSRRINEKKHCIGYYSMRVTMIVGTILIAIIIPELGPFISLVGAMCFSLLGLLCPSIIHIATLYHEGYGFMKWRLIKDVIISLLSFVALVSGSYSSLLDIIAMYTEKKE